MFKYILYIYINNNILHQQECPSTVFGLSLGLDHSMWGCVVVHRLMHRLIFIFCYNKNHFFFFSSFSLQSLGTLSPYSQVNVPPPMEVELLVVPAQRSQINPTPPSAPQDYDSVDFKQRRCSSPGFIDSPTYSRQSMSPIMPRSPQHYVYPGESFTLETLHLQQASV